MVGTLEVSDSTEYCVAPSGKKCYDLVWTLANQGGTEDRVSGYSIGFGGGTASVRFGSFSGCSGTPASIDCSPPDIQTNFPAGHTETRRFPIIVDEPPSACPNSVEVIYSVSAVNTPSNGVTSLQIPCTVSVLSSASSSSVLHGCIDPDGDDFYTKTHAEYYWNGTLDPRKGGTDSCDATQVLEYSCSATDSYIFGPTARRYNCPRGCQDGTCVKAPNVCQNGQIPVGSHPRSLVAVGSKVYVLNFTSRSISVINTATNTVANTILLGSRADAIAAVGSNVYVANSVNASVSVINSSTDTVTATIPVDASPSSFTVVGTRIYVLHQGGYNITVFNTATNAVESSIPIGDYTVALATDGSKVFAANEHSTISVINTATNSVTATISVPSRPTSLIVAGSKLYVANWDDETVSVINTATNMLEATIPMGTNPGTFAVSAGKVYVANTLSSSVSVINTATNTVTATIPVGSRPMAIVAAGSKLFVTNGSAVSVINTATDTVTATIPSGYGSQSLVVSGTKVYVAGNFVEGTVTIIDTATDTLSCNALSSSSSSASSVISSSSISSVSAVSSSSTGQSLCGNGLITQGEQCDDANGTNGDGCSAACTKETGWYCNAAVPSVCSPFCGDGIVLAGREPCDDKNFLNGDGCSASCQREPGWTCSGIPSSCLTL
ncbi:MAG: DUF4215 domain-containing protein, partial [Candidatus Peribacteraceae bacterium]|nr:DUF4215 domain-containing protein [Candidatus Peribacteraceae bacterium]